MKLYPNHTACTNDEVPRWVQHAAAQRATAQKIADEQVRKKAKAVRKATGKWPHKSLMAVAGMAYMEQALGHAVEAMMIGTAGYYEIAGIIEAEDIEEGDFDMSIDGHKFTLYHNPELPEFATAIPLQNSQSL